MKITDDVPKIVLVGVYIEIAIRMFLVIIFANIAKILTKISGRLLMFTDILTWQYDADNTDITAIIGREIIVERKRERHG